MQIIPNKLKISPRLQIDGRNQWQNEASPAGSARERNTCKRCPTKIYEIKCNSRCPISIPTRRQKMLTLTRRQVLNSHLLAKRLKTTRYPRESSAVKRRSSSTCMLVNSSTDSWQLIFRNPGIVLSSVPNSLFYKPPIFIYTNLSGSYITNYTLQFSQGNSKLLLQPKSIRINKQITVVCKNTAKTNTQSCQKNK